MEFNEKLQELRKAKGLTQEELAEELFVSRTAISKWESGRGYPSIDSLKEISRFFSVSIDELICAQEILSVAENDKKDFARKTISLICVALDVLMVMLLFLPVFGNGEASPESVTIFKITGIAPWIKTAFLVLIIATVLNGIGGIVVSRFGNPTWNKHRLMTGMVLSMLGSIVSIATRQPYAGILFFAILIIKGFLMISPDVFKKEITNE